MHPFLSRRVYINEKENLFYCLPMNYLFSNKIKAFRELLIMMTLLRFHKEIERYFKVITKNGNFLMNNLNFTEYNASLVLPYKFRFIIMEINYH